MSISVPEIIALLIEASPNDADEWRNLDFTQPHTKPFVSFCAAMYDKGLAHGRHDALCDARQALVEAGQTGAITVIERLSQ